MCQKRDSLNLLRFQIDGLTKTLAAVLQEPDPPPQLPRAAVRHTRRTRPVVPVGE